VDGGAHSYSYLTCYVTIAAQINGLSWAGFNEVLAYDIQGEIVTEDTTSPWIYYVTRKKLAHCGTVESKGCEAEEPSSLRDSLATNDKHLRAGS
jgi:hypothetical protein